MYNEIQSTEYGIQHTEYGIRNTVLFGLGLVSGAVLAYWLLRPARVRRARVAAVYQDGFWYADVTWAYGSGVRPVSLIVDVRAANGAHGSLTTTGATRSGKLPLSAPFNGDYELTVTATYRAVGRFRTVTERLGVKG